MFDFFNFALQAKLEIAAKKADDDGEEEATNKVLEAYRLVQEKMADDRFVSSTLDKAGLPALAEKKDLKQHLERKMKKLFESLSEHPKSALEKLGLAALESSIALEMHRIMEMSPVVEADALMQQQEQSCDVNDLQQQMDQLQEFNDYLVRNAECWENTARDSSDAMRVMEHANQAMEEEKNEFIDHHRKKIRHFGKVRRQLLSDVSMLGDMVEKERRKMEELVKENKVTKKKNLAIGHELRRQVSLNRMLRIAPQQMERHHCEVVKHLSKDLARSKSECEEKSLQLEGLVGENEQLKQKLKNLETVVEQVRKLNVRMARSQIRTRMRGAEDWPVPRRVWMARAECRRLRRTLMSNGSSAMAKNEETRLLCNQVITKIKYLENYLDVLMEGVEGKKDGCVDMSEEVVDSCTIMEEPEENEDKSCDDMQPVMDAINCH